MTHPHFQIRSYEPADASALLEVCLQTGSDGEDASHLYEDPEALGRIYVAPYLQLEPSLAFVLADASGPCGYVLGALDSVSFYQRYRAEYLPDLCRRFPAPLGHPDHWTATQRAYHEYHHPDLHCPEPYAQYPSHLHIDLLPRAQGEGHGKAMMEHLLAKLREAGSPGVHLGVGRVNQRAQGFYRHLGFTTLEERSDVVYLGLPFLT